MKIVADAEIAYVTEYFYAYGELILKPGRHISNDDVKDADILLVRSITPVDQTLLANSSITFVGSVTAGTDHLDVAWLNQHNIHWRAATGFNAEPVADYVVGVIAALQKKGLLLGSSKKAAVIGVGNIGRLVVERLKSLHFEVIYVDPIRAQAEKNFISIPFEYVADVDLVSLHVPLSRDGDYPTYQFINKQFLEKQKAGCVLLNASRGDVIHPEDLKQYGKHCHWCFDVWPNEPTIDPAILEAALIATPHIAGYSAQSKIRGIEMIYQAACEMGIIKPQAVNILPRPQPHLLINHHQLNWQDLVFGVFDPLRITVNIKETLLRANNSAIKFDELRRGFHDRRELSVEAFSLAMKRLECENTDYLP